LCRVCLESNIDFGRAWLAREGQKSVLPAVAKTEKMKFQHQHCSFSCLWIVYTVVYSYSPSSVVVQCLSQQLMVLGAGQVGQAVLDATQSKFDVQIGVVRTTPTPSPVVLQANDDDNADSNMLGGRVKTTTTMFLHWDRDMNAILDHAKTCTHLLVTLPPNVRSEQCAAIAANLSSKQLSWLGVVSTTGVYGNHNGEWVTEGSECKGNENYLDHETAWADRFRHGPLTIFRCAGIYGPQASALHTVFRNGINNNEEDLEGYPTSRIHLDDIVSAITASMMMIVKVDDDQGCYSRHSCYNLSDDEPAPRSTVLLYASQLLESIGVSIPLHRPPTTTTTGRSGRAQRRQTDNKRVCNRLLKKTLVSKLKYPTYREGLSAILNDKSCPWWWQ
jgi:nucleoside-diphosphate-sugar epimerase